MNHDTVKTILKNIDANDPNEFVLQHFLLNGNYNDPLAIPTLTKHANQYANADHKASKRELQFR